MDPAPPILHILAGPNGAGKSSLYDATIRRLTAAEFVNPDRLVHAHVGAHAQTKAEAELGQQMADARRTALMEARLSLVTESTFSHVSKLELVRSALTIGYEVVIYHVSLESADLAVARVEARRANGGHPVPEDRIRGRYVRNGQIIREAILLSQRGFVFDNSVLGRPPRRLLTFVQGHATDVAPELPGWARTIYADDLAVHEAAVGGGRR